MESRLVGIVVALIIGVAVVAYKFSKKDEQAADFHEQIMSYIQQLPDYGTHGSLYNEWFDRHHEALFEKHYRMGGRYSSGYFDGDSYLDELFTAMIVDAVDAGYKEQAENLEILSEEVYWEVE